MTANDARRELRRCADKERASSAGRFFKTGPGQYGEGDVFIGVRAADLRRLAKDFRTLPAKEVESLLRSTIHEERALALLIMVQQATKASAEERKRLFDFYFANVRHVNNWDLVDVSAPTIVGGHLAGNGRRALLKLAKSKNLWERRIAIVGTQHWIRAGQFDDTLAVADVLLDDEEDLIHKAVGWMLREVGDRDRGLLEAFLRVRYDTMPRTMLRYAIEKFPSKRRLDYLKGRIT